MKKPLTALVLFALSATAAQANNPSIENALKRRPDLSAFYQAMVTTGVADELSPGAMYSIFVPTNEALARISPVNYPCFYSVECRAEVADIIRNHIVEGEQHADDIVAHEGGVYSINHHFIPVGAPNRGTYTAGGNNILYTTWITGGVLYKIDGVIAGPDEMAAFQQLKTPVTQSTTVTTSEHTIADPDCIGGRCADAGTTTTTVTHTVTPLSPDQSW